MKLMTRVVLLGCVLVVAGLLSHVGPALAQEAPEVTARDVVDRDYPESLRPGGDCMAGGAVREWRGYKH